MLVPGRGGWHQDGEKGPAGMRGAYGCKLTTPSIIYGTLWEYSRLTLYEDRRTTSVAGSPGRPAAQGGSRHHRPRHESGRGGAGLWCGPDQHSPVAEGCWESRPCGPQGPQARPQGTVSPGGASGGHGRADDRGSLPGPASPAVRPVDAGSRLAVDRPAVRHRRLGLDGGPLPAGLGLHAAETPSPGLRTGCGGGGTDAWPSRTCPSARSMAAERGAGLPELPRHPWEHGRLAGVPYGSVTSLALRPAATEPA